MPWYFDPAQLVADIRQSHPPSKRLVEVSAPDPVQLSQLATGHRVLTCEELVHICDHFGLTPADYFKARL